MIIRNKELFKDNFRSRISRTEDCELIDSAICEAILKDDGFYRTVVRIEVMQGTQVPILYWKNIVEVLRNQVALGEPQIHLSDTPAISDGTRSHPT